MGNGDEEEFTEDDIIEMVTNEANRSVNNENEACLLYTSRCV